MDPKSKYTSYLLFQKFKPELKLFFIENFILLEIIITSKHTHKSVSEMAGRWSIILSYTEIYNV